MPRFGHRLLPALALLLIAPTAASHATEVTFSDGATHTADASLNGSDVTVTADPQGHPTTLRIPAGVSLRVVTADQRGIIVLDGGSITQSAEARHDGTLRLGRGTVSGRVTAHLRGVCEIDGTTLTGVFSLNAGNRGSIRARATTLPATCRLEANDGDVRLTDVTCLDTDWGVVAGATLRFEHCRFEGPDYCGLSAAQSVEFVGGSILKPTKGLSLPSVASFTGTAIRTRTLIANGSLALRDCDVVAQTLSANGYGFSIHGGRFAGFRQIGFSGEIDLSDTIAVPAQLMLAPGPLKLRVADAFVLREGGTNVQLIATASDGTPISAPIRWLARGRELQLVTAGGRTLAVPRGDAVALPAVPTELLPFVDALSRRSPAFAPFTAPLITTAIGLLIPLAFFPLRNRLRLRRPRLAALTIFSLALCLAVNALWSRSLARADVWAHARPDGTLTLIASDAGALRLWSDRHAALSTADTWVHATGRARLLQPVFPAPRWAAAQTDVWLLPYWLPCLVAAVLPLAWLLATARAWLIARRDPWACPHCGYNLRATPERCPECGRMPVVSAAGPFANSGSIRS